MKQVIPLFLALCACSSNNNTCCLTGRWLEILPPDASYVQGMHLKEDGSAESVGMSTLLYHQWKVIDNQLILNGESVGNGQTIPFADTMNIIKHNNDTLIIQRKNNNIMFVKDDGTDKPTRKAYEGFIWKKLSGAGLTLWAQENDDIRLIADPSLPGIVMVRNGSETPHKLIQVFNLPNKNINDIISILEKSGNWDKQQSCKFEEIQSLKKGVRKFILIPDGDYAATVKEQMKSEPVPTTCNGWGIGNSGQRYFEIHDNCPDKAIFIEIGQEAPLFDEHSIVLSCHNTPPQKTEMSKDELYILKGTLTLGHEVRSFKPENCPNEYWIVDKTNTLTDLYDKETEGKKNAESNSKCNVSKNF